MHPHDLAVSQLVDDPVLVIELDPALRTVRLGDDEREHEPPVGEELPRLHHEADRLHDVAEPRAYSFETAVAPVALGPRERGVDPHVGGEARFERVRVAGVPRAEGAADHVDVRAGLGVHCANDDA